MLILKSVVLFLLVFFIMTYLNTGMQILIKKPTKSITVHETFLIPILAVVLFILNNL